MGELMIKALDLYSYKIPLKIGTQREGVIVKVTDDNGRVGWGEVAPYPKLSKETVAQTVEQLQEKASQIMCIGWSIANWHEQLKKLNLYPSVSFGLESALLALMDPIKEYSVPANPLLMGTVDEIIHQAAARAKEGFTIAKLKVSNLSFEEAAWAIDKVRGMFKLRVDVNRSWKIDDSIRFFSRYPKDYFEYIEEPCADPSDLKHFTHPLAVDESFPGNLSLEDLEKIPNLKAIIYKPTVHGGFADCVTLNNWARKQGVHLVLSSSFESDIGLFHVASLAKRLSIQSHVGLGTYHYLDKYLCSDPLLFSNDQINLPLVLFPKESSVMRI